jgi:peptide/nickel transport system permease protein
MSRIKSRNVWKRLLSNKLSVIGFSLTVILILVGTLAPWLAPYDAKEMMFEFALEAPSGQFWFGTDSLGRDMLSRIIWGARTSLYVGFLATGLALIIGVLFGSLAGYFQRTMGPIFMRLADIQLSIPNIVLLIVAASVIGDRSLGIIVVIIGITMWPSMGRVARSKVMDLKTEDFVDAARMSGASHFRIIWRHILPNGLGPIIVIATLDIGTAIVAEAGLSFLGLGDPKAISWGQMITRGIEDMTYAPWTVIFPGLSIFLTVWGLNMFGDALRDTLDVEV